MSMSEMLDTVIQNQGAVKNEKAKGNDASPAPSRSHADKADEKEEGEIDQLRKTIQFFYSKFKRQELTEEDFQHCISKLELDKNHNIATHEKKTSKEIELCLDDVMQVDFELDFEDGKVELKHKSKDRFCVHCAERTKQKSPRTYDFTQEDKNMKLQMKKLMTTFEQEKRNLVQKLENEKQASSKQLTQKYEKQLKAEKDFLGTVIAELVKSLEEAKDEADQLKLLREQDRTSLQKYYNKKLAEEKKKIMFEVKNG